MPREDVKWIGYSVGGGPTVIACCRLAGFSWRLATGCVTVALRSWSRPAHWLTRLGYPLARRWQLQAARAALDHLQSIAAVQ